MIRERERERERESFGELFLLDVFIRVGRGLWKLSWPGCQ